MKTKEKVLEQLRRYRQIEREYRGCTIGTEGYEIWVLHINWVKCLEWVLEDKDQ